MACTMVISGYEHAFNLILLDMVELDIILGINWLARFRTMIDFNAYNMNFVMPKGARF